MRDTKIEGASGNGATTPPVYLRLQKRAQEVSGRPGPTREQGRIRALSGFLVLLCVMCVLWLLAGYLETNPRFQLHSLDLSGGQYVARSEVEKVFADDHDVSIFAIPLEQRRRQLEQIRWVRSATITRVLPDRLAIAVEERQPVAFLWTRHGVELVDQEGVILETPPKDKKNASWTFPVLRGVSDREKVEKRKERIGRYLKLMEALQQANGGALEEISEVDLTEPDDICAVVTDGSGALRLHLGDENFRERYEVYRSHIAEWRQQFNEIHSIDLRYEGQAVIQSGVPLTVRLDDPPKSSPAAAASAPGKERPAPASPSARTAL
ncbi:MAG: FtsQ-type POTRA domain-containing protein [Acidobacteria bacterium]|nr:FtsQ-type POTRA domain-containing protein [Acidobacteriota bacterium]